MRPSQGRCAVLWRDAVERRRGTAVVIAALFWITPLSMLVLHYLADEGVGLRLIDPVRVANALENFAGKSRTGNIMCSSEDYFLFSCTKRTMSNRNYSQQLPQLCLPRKLPQYSEKDKIVPTAPSPCGSFLRSSTHFLTLPSPD